MSQIFGRPKFWNAFLRVLLLSLKSFARGTFLGLAWVVSFNKTTKPFYTAKKGLFALRFTFSKVFCWTWFYFVFLLRLFFAKLSKSFLGKLSQDFLATLLRTSSKGGPLCGCLQKGLAFPKNVVLLLNLLVVFRKQLFFHLSQKRQSFADCLSFFNLCFI